MRSPLPREYRLESIGDGLDLERPLGVRPGAKPHRGAGLRVGDELEEGGPRRIAILRLDDDARVDSRDDPRREVLLRDRQEQRPLGAEVREDLRRDGKHARIATEHADEDVCRGQHRGEILERLERHDGDVRRARAP